MRPELRLLLWWLLFGGTHILGSAVPLRTRLIGLLGLRGFKAAYSVVALATFVPLVWTYWHERHVGPILFMPPGWARHVTETLMLLATVCLALGFVTPQPASTASELSGRFASAPRGIHRITRHPVNTAFALFGLAHMLVNPTLTDWVFWGGFPVYALLSAWHQDRRALAVGPQEFKAFHAASSLVPFAAVLSGRQRVAVSELRWWAVVAALALFAVLRSIHPTVIGGFD